LDNNEKPDEVIEWKKKPQVAECYNMLYESVNQGDEESDSYITLIVKKMWLKKDKIKELHLAWVASVAEIILNPDCPHIKLSENIVEPILKKNIVSIK
jgi:hypothetical protein